MTSARHLTIQDLLVYLDSVQRHYGGDIPCYVQAPGPGGVQTLAPLLEAATQHGANGFVALRLGAGRREEAAMSDDPAGRWRPEGPAPTLDILMEPTDQLVQLDGVLCRVWYGMTDTGVPCVVFVHSLAARGATPDRAQVTRTLQAVLPPGRVVELRQVLESNSSGE